MAGITYYTYNRDTSKDIIVTQNNTQSSGYLVDGNGNILMINGKAIYVTLETPYNLTFSISGIDVPAPTVTVINGNNTISVSNGDIITVYGECTINAVSNENKHIQIRKDGTVASAGDALVSYTFIPTENCAISVISGNK